MNPLRAFREAREMTQADLAALLGCTQGTISHVEVGRRRATPEQAAEWHRITEGGIDRAALRPDIFDEVAA